MITKLVHLDLGVSVFYRRFMTGEGQTFEPQVDAFQTSENVTVLISGKLRTYNSSRYDELDVEAGPFRIAGGTLLPGTYVIEALEDSEYCCISRLPDKHGPFPMFKLTHHYLTAGETLPVPKEDRAVLIMSGDVTISGKSYGQSSRHDNFEDSVIEAVTDTHVIIYRNI